MKRARTPEEIANQATGKDKITLYLSVEPIEYIKERCAKSKKKVSVSEVVDEAIRMYIESIKSEKR